MARGRAVEIVLDGPEKEALMALTRKHGAPQSLAMRAAPTLYATLKYIIRSIR